MIDFKKINQHILGQFTSLITQWIPGGVQSGEYYTVRNPTRDDKTAGSFRINTIVGHWLDFSTQDKGGDPVSLYAYINRTTNAKAAQELAEKYSIAAPKAGNPISIISPVPSDAPALPTQFPKLLPNKLWERYNITHHWAYRDAAGEVVMYITRCQTPNGKETPPLTLWHTDNGKTKWRFKGLPGNRPIYNLDRISNNPNAQIILVEGEKCAETLQGLIDSAGLKNFIAITWQGGVDGYKKTDFATVKNRNVIAWPDFDKKPDLPDYKQPGLRVMLAISKILSQTGCTVRIIKPVADKPDGWDVADAILIDGWNLQQIMVFIKTNAGDKILPSESESVPTPEAPAAPAAPAAPVTTARAESRWPFRCLGYSNTHYFYLPNGTKQVHTIKGEGHSKATLLTLAPIQFWEHNFHDDYSAAANALLRTSENQGVYDISKRRGLGGWFDAGRSVLHLGDRLIVDGKETGIHDIDSKFIYEAGRCLEIGNEKPITTIEANQIQKISDMLFWEKPIHGKLLAGWCVIAPICGALRHRPHIWMTAKKGSGKTWVLDEIIAPLLGEMCQFFQSKSTEAGIRQSLQSDALPVMIDEFEGENDAAQKRVQAILDLARASYSDSEGYIGHGGQNGHAVLYKIRSTFFMSSIGVNMSNSADESRTSIISLEEPHDTSTETKAQHFERLANLVSSTLTEKYCAGFRARSFKLIPAIRDNAKIFSKAVSVKIGNQRAGDQLGALLAGAYSLVSDKIITDEAARAWVDTREWEEQKEVSERSDEMDCLNEILCSTVRTAHEGEISIHELLDICAKHRTELQTNYEVCRELLMRYGIKYSDGIIWVSDSQGVKKLLAKTQWAKTWGRSLKRIPDAQTIKSMRFIGCDTRATGIPYEIAGALDKTAPVEF